MENSNIWLQLILGVIVLIPPIWTIWKSYYDKFRIAIIVDRIQLGIHEWDSNRFEIRFFVPMELVNISNTVGIVTDMRLKLNYQIMGPIHYSEYVYGEHVLISQDDKQFTFQARGDSLHTILKNESLAFVLVPEQSAEKHIMFKTFWKRLKIVDSFQISLEVQLNNKKWKNYREWECHLRQVDYNLYISGGGVMPMEVKKTSWRIMELWRAHMLNKIHMKYDSDVNINKIKVKESMSKW